MVAPMGTSLSRWTRWFVVEVVKIGCWVKCRKGTTNINKKENARLGMCVMWCATCCVANVLYSHSFWKGINYRIYSNHLFAPFGVPGQLPGSPWPVDVSMSIRSCKKTRKEKENHVQVLIISTPRKTIILHLRITTGSQEIPIGNHHF